MMGLSSFLFLLHMDLALLWDETDPGDGEADKTQCFGTRSVLVIKELVIHDSEVPPLPALHD